MIYVASLVVKQLPKKDVEQAHGLSKKEWLAVNNSRGISWKVNEKEFGAYIDGKIVGVVRMEIIGGAAYLEDFIVAKAARKHGAGMLLFRKFEEYAKRKGCHVACIETSANLPYAIRFYEKKSYRTEARLKNSRFHTTVLFMTKALR